MSLNCVRFGVRLRLNKVQQCTWRSLNPLDNFLVSNALQPETTYYYFHSDQLDIL